MSQAIKKYMYYIFMLYIMYKRHKSKSGIINELYKDQVLGLSQKDWDKVVDFPNNFNG